MTRNGESSVWDCMFGGSKWVDCFNKQNDKNVMLVFERSGAKKNFNHYSKEHLFTEMSDVNNVEYSKKPDSLKNECLGTNTDCEKVAKGKEVGCKIELLWALKCPTCKKHHACHCRYSPVKIGEDIDPNQSIDRQDSYTTELEKKARECALAKEKLEKERDDLLAKLKAEKAAKEKILSKEKEDNERIQKLIEERDKLLTEADEKKKKLLGDIENVFDIMDSKLTGVENLLRCIESYKNTLNNQNALAEARYQLVRSDSNPSILCIRPPTNSAYNICQNIVKGDCVRTTPDSENFVIHGNQYVNDDDTLTVCNIIRQLIDQQMMDDSVFTNLLKMLKCFNPFPIDFDETEDKVELDESIKDDDISDKIDQFDLDENESWKDERIEFEYRKETKVVNSQVQVEGADTIGYRGSYTGNNKLSINVSSRNSGVTLANLQDRYAGLHTNSVTRNNAHSSLMSTTSNNRNSLHNSNNQTTNNISIHNQPVQNTMLTESSPKKSSLTRFSFTDSTGKGANVRVKSPSISSCSDAEVLSCAENSKATVNKTGAINMFNVVRISKGPHKSNCKR